MYGFSVYQFETLQKRIELGKKLAALLFHWYKVYSIGLHRKRYTQDQEQIMNVM